MISIAYVNDTHEPLLLSDPYLKFESAIEEIDNDINKICEESANIYNKIMFESTVMGTSITEAQKEEIKKTNTNVFESIGKSIIKVIESIKEFIKKIFSKMSGFEKKSDLDKLQAAAKGKDPEVVKGLYDAFNSGKLTVYDAKSIKDVEDAYLEFLKFANQKDINPNTLSGKLELFKKKCQEADKSGLVSVAKATTAITGGIMAIPLIRKTLADIKKSTMDVSEKMIKNGENLSDYITKMQNSSNPDVKAAVDPSLGQATIRKNAYLFMTSQYEKMIKQNESTYSKIMGLAKGIISKIDKNGVVTSKIDNAIQKESDKKTASGNKLLAGAKAQNEIKNPPTNREAERQKNREDAKDRVLAQKKAELEFNKTHKKQLNSATYNTSKAQKNAQMDADDEHYKRKEATILQRERDKAEYQAKGREAGTTKPKRDIKKDAKQDELGRLEARDEYAKKNKK